jgi:hypothetical protein
MDRLTAARCNAARCNVAGCGCAQVATTREENRKLRLEMQALLTVRRSVRSRPRLLPQCTTLHDSATNFARNTLCCVATRCAALQHVASRCNTLLSGAQDVKQLQKAVASKPSAPADMPRAMYAERPPLSTPRSLSPCSAWEPSANLRGAA